MQNQNMKIKYTNMKCAKQKFNFLKNCDNI